MLHRSSGRRPWKAVLLCLFATLGVNSPRTTEKTGTGLIAAHRTRYILLIARNAGRPPPRAAILFGLTECLVGTVYLAELSVNCGQDFVAPT